MAAPAGGEPLPEARRREVFQLLVTAQDVDMTVEESRQMIRDLFGLAEEEVVRIEREGLAARWPPLQDERPARP